MITHVGVTFVDRCLASVSASHFYTVNDMRTRVGRSGVIRDSNGGRHDGVSSRDAPENG